MMQEASHQKSGRMQGFSRIRCNCGIGTWASIEDAEQFPPMQGRDLEHVNPIECAEAARKVSRPLLPERL